MLSKAREGGVSFLDNLPAHPKVQAAVQDHHGVARGDRRRRRVRSRTSPTFLERDLLPRSRGIYAVGEAHFNLLLKKKHFLDHDAASLLALGESLFVKTKQELESIAEELAARQRR